MHTPRPRASTALAAVAVAAGLVTASTPAQAIVGTPSPDTAYAFTAQLRIGSGEQARACSGALIDPRWIVTAASCFAASPLQGGEVAPGAPAYRTVATIGRADLTAGTGGHVTEVTHLVPRADRDVVLARLATPATGIRPVALASGPAAAGDTLKVAGYGRTKTQWVPDRLHVASFGVHTVDGTTLGITGATAADSVCMGDSGGPVLRERDGALELVGVSSRSWQGGCFGVEETRNGAVAARTDGIAVGDRLAAGQRLRSGETLASGSATLTMRADGNLVVTSRAGKVLWSSGTGGKAGATAEFGADGNLVVRDAAGTAALWQSGTAAAGGSLVLQERGDLVVRDAQGHTRWTTGTAVRNDFDGDARADMLGWYDYADGRDILYRFGGSDTGALAYPLAGYTSPAGGLDHARVKKVSGDFNGDGNADVAIMYGYADGSVKMWTYVSQGNGSFAAPFASWSAPAGSFTWSRARLESGDFNGDGRDDVAAWYDYADGRDTLFTFLSDQRGGFGTPVTGWTAPNNWTASKSKYVTGDFNGDGRDDIGVLYDYDGGAVKLWTFLATPTGGFSAPRVAWDHPTWGDWARTDLHSGDFDGDGRDDAVLWFDYQDGRDVVYVLKGNADGTVASPRTALTSAAGNLTHSSMKIVLADYNGDGRDDIGAMYGYADGNVKMFTWPTKADGTSDSVRVGWGSATAGSWGFARTHFLNRHNNS
ncbi:FG-GAP-like repeat-containing protein [Streptomyces sp. enrichment culture]|uniref:FG-GAP-like repeat-containing protein n=1 Tax=Streptomyces sp. enrichment culture TaxID=1795815 RepID=UPI003F54F75F